LSTDFGLKEFNVKSEKERIIRYRRYVYEAGALKQPETGSVKVIDDKVLDEERSRELELSKSDRFVSKEVSHHFFADFSNFLSDCRPKFFLPFFLTNGIFYAIVAT
jgi:hypothetical protein